MNSSLVAVLLVVCLGVVNSSEDEFECLSREDMMPGGNACMTDSELQEEKIKNFTLESVNRYKQQKEAANQLHECEELTGTVTKGSRQVVAGLNYRLKITIVSSKKDTDECTNEEFSTSERECKSKIFEPLPHTGQDPQYVVTCQENNSVE